MRRQILLASLVVVLASLPSAWAVKCYDCVGANCMGNFCEGKYCALGQFAPRWGSLTYGNTNIVKGCMNGTLLRKDVRSHCEVAGDDEKDVSTCFCNNKDNCNGGQAARKLPAENVELIKCKCTGDHCQGKSCIGEMCSYVYNHITKEVERGCVNASIPLLERRSMGSCMSPPVTGAMHHSVAMRPNELLMTESCICGVAYCNVDKPETKAPERMTCPAGVAVNIKGSKMKATNTTCEGEFCFIVEIKSTLGPIKEYWAMGCATFTGEDDLAEELNPTGCAEFKSEQLNVSACYRTDDKDAKGRARAKQKVTSRGRKGKERGKKPSRKEEEEEEEQDQEQEQEQEEEEEEEERQEKPKEEEEQREESKETEKNEKKEENKEEKEEKAVSSHSKDFIFQEPTEAPIPDESNATMITVFILIMLCIVVSGAVWKFELHKKLFRSSYDTVAGG